MSSPPLIESLVLWGSKVVALLIAGCPPVILFVSRVLYWCCKADRHRRRTEETGDVLRQEYLQESIYRDVTSSSSSSEEEEEEVEEDPHWLLREREEEATISEEGGGEHWRRRRQQAVHQQENYYCGGGTIGVIDFLTSMAACTLFLCILAAAAALLTIPLHTTPGTFTILKDHNMDDTKKNNDATNIPTSKNVLVVVVPRELLLTVNVAPPRRWPVLVAIYLLVNVFAVFLSRSAFCYGRWYFRKKIPLNRQTGLAVATGLQTIVSAIFILPAILKTTTTIGSIPLNNQYRLPSQASINLVAGIQSLHFYLLNVLLVFYSFTLLHKVSTSRLTRLQTTIRFTGVLGIHILTAFIGLLPSLLPDEWLVRGDYFLALTLLVGSTYLALSLLYCFSIKQLKVLPLT